MNAFELSNPFLLLGAGALIGVLVLGALVLAWLLRAYQHTRQDLDAMAAQLNVFTQTSIEVARTVEGLAAGEQKIDQQVSSRRWLIDEARIRLRDGGELDQVAKQLRLNHDETSLLHKVCLTRQLVP